VKPERLIVLAALLSLAGIGVALTVQGSVANVTAAWSQWGGPNQDFRAPAAGLASGWPDAGPERLWSRNLGDGYSAILFEEGRLYTMYRSGEMEVVVCLAAETGKTIWEHSYDAPYRGFRGYGTGPRSTPVISGDLLFTIGASGELKALNKNNGQGLWGHSLWGVDFNGKIHSHGYSSSPVAYNETLIVLVGGENSSLVAFNQTNGSVKWRALSSRNSYSSPRVVKLAGEDQLLVFMAEELIGVDPENGTLRWRYPHANQWGMNISMPTVVGGDTIFLSSPQAGAKGLRLARNGVEFEVEELWSTRRVQFYHGSTIQNGDWVYGSSGVTTPAFMMSVNIQSGEIGWRQRGFAKANCVEADGKLVILDEDGMLYLTTATPEKIEVHAKTQLLNRVAWTVPTIVGTKMYVRDNKQIIAVELG
jgi:outer membrane protein assembly factor BamB